jgi:hypothetical protein
LSVAVDADSCPSRFWRLRILLLGVFLKMQPAWYGEDQALLHSLD